MLSKLVEGFSWSEGCTGHQVWLALTRDDVCLLVGWIYNSGDSGMTSHSGTWIRQMADMTHWRVT